MPDRMRRYNAEGICAICGATETDYLYWGNDFFEKRGQYEICSKCINKIPKEGVKIKKFSEDDDP